MENVVKMFFLEERVIDLTSNIGMKKVQEKIFSESSKNLNHEVNNKTTQFLTVRGLN